MTPTIQIGLTPQAEAVLARVKQIPQRTLQGIARGMNVANQETVGVIQKQFLNFPREGPATLEGLRHQTGHLFRSLRASKAVIVGEAVLSGIGSNLKYMGPHEMGFTGTVQVPAHTRRPGARFLLGNKIVNPRKGGELLTKSGKARKNSNLIPIHESRAALIEVKAHTMKVNLPARAPIRRGIIRNMDRTRQLVSSEIIKSINASGGTP